MDQPHEVWLEIADRLGVTAQTVGIFFYFFSIVKNAGILNFLAIRQTIANRGKILQPALFIWKKCFAFRVKNVWIAQPKKI